MITEIFMAFSFCFKALVIGFTHPESSPGLFATRKTRTEKPPY